MSFFSGMLKQLYTTGSLANTEDGFRFELKNRLLAAKLHGVHRVAVDGREVALEGSRIVCDDGRVFGHGDVSPATPAEFALGDRFEVRLLLGVPLTPGEHALTIEFEATPVGRTVLEVKDVVVG